MDRCAECGAALDGSTCADRLGLIIAWEAQDAELGREHFLTVASYNLQHPSSFTDPARAALREVFIAHLDDAMPIREIRRRMSEIAEGSARVTKWADERHVIPREWTMTIADVALADQPSGAADRVRAWAKSIRSELDNS